MNYQLEHVAIYTKDIAESIKYYEKFFGGHATPIRKGSAGYGFCFVRIAGAPSIQLMESAGQVGVYHYGYVTDDIEQVAKEFKEKGAEILRVTGRKDLWGEVEEFICNTCRFERKRTTDWVIEGPRKIDRHSVIGHGHYADRLKQKLLISAAPDAPKVEPFNIMER